MRTDGPRRVCVIGGSGAGKTTVAARLAEAWGLEQVELDGEWFAGDWVRRPGAEVRSRVLARLDAAETAEAVLSERPSTSDSPVASASSDSPDSSAASDSLDSSASSDVSHASDPSDTSTKGVDAGRGWVTDGNLIELGEAIWSRADTIIWVDVSRLRRVVRLWRRSVPRIRRRQVLWAETSAAGQGQRETWAALLSPRPSRNVWMRTILLHGRWRRHARARETHAAAHDVEFAHLRGHRALTTWLDHR